MSNLISTKKCTYEILALVHLEVNLVAFSADGLQNEVILAPPKNEGLEHFVCGSGENEFSIFSAYEATLLYPTLHEQPTPTEVRLQCAKAQR